MLENFSDGFAMEQNTPLESVSASDSLISSSSHSGGSSTHSMSASSHGAFASLAIYSSSSLDMVQLKELIVRMRRIYTEYNTIHFGTFSGSGTQNPHSRYVSASSVVSSSAEDVALCFKEVPGVFFKSDFSLQTLDTFILTLGSRAQLFNEGDQRQNATLDSSMKNSGGGKSGNKMNDCSVNGRVSNKQQENLSRYLDLVEIALLKHIWSRSPAFFRALDDIKGLQTQVQAASSCLTRLRIRLQSIDEETAVGAMRIPQMYTRQKNESSLSEKIACIQRVLQARTEIQCLLDVEDYLGALHEIGFAKKLFSDELVGLSCVGMVGQQLNEYDDLVCEIMCNRFVSLAVECEEFEIIEDDRVMKVERRGSNILDEFDSTSLEASGIDAASGGNESESLENLMLALLRCGRLASALNMYKNRLSEAIKLIVRTCVQEYLSSSFDPSMLQGDGFDSDVGTDSNGEKEADSTPFAQRVKEMGDDNFLSCLAMSFEHTIMALTRSERVDRFIEKALKKPLKPCDGETHAVDTSTATAASADLLILSKSCLAAACDLAQRSVAQLLALRREGTARISMEKMKFMWEISLHFVLTLEGLSGSTAYVIRQCLLTQTRAFLEHMHSTVKGRLASTLDSERWAQCDVSLERQLEIDRLSAGKASLQQQTEIEVDADRRISNGQAGGITAAGKKKDCKPALVDGAPFKVVWSVMLLTEIILNYLNISVSFAPVTTDVIGKTVELLKLFDHRTKQLVLGAQAIQSAARLKSISAKHLAVTAQSIGLLLALLPHIRAAILAQLPPKHHMQLLELDRVSHALIDHHGRIVAKFVGIVGDFVDQSAIRLRTVDWDSYKQGPQASSPSCEYFEEIQRTVTALHRVLLETLPPEQVQDVFSRIFALLNRRIPMHFEETMPSTAAGKQRILDEVAHLVIAFSRLKQIDQVALLATATLEESFRRRYGVVISNTANACMAESSDRSTAAGNSHSPLSDRSAVSGTESYHMSNAAVGRSNS